MRLHNKALVRTANYTALRLYRTAWSLDFKGDFCGTPDREKGSKPYITTTGFDIPTLI